MERNQQNYISRCNERLQQLGYAIHCHLGEEGTTNEQDTLLFECGFIEECRAYTKCGYSVDLRRDPQVGIIADAAVSTLLEIEAEGRAFVRVVGRNGEESTLGWVAMRVPSQDERTQHRLDQELQSNAVNFLPEWARKAVLRAFEAKEVSDHLLTKKVPARRADQLSQIMVMLDEVRDSKGAIDTMPTSGDPDVSSEEDSFDEALRNLTLSQKELEDAEEALAAAQRAHKEVVKAFIRAAKPQ